VNGCKVEAASSPESFRGRKCRFYMATLQTQRPIPNGRAERARECSVARSIRRKTVRQVVRCPAWWWQRKLLAARERGTDRKQNRYRQNRYLSARKFSPMRSRQLARSYSKESHWFAFASRVRLVRSGKDNGPPKASSPVRSRHSRERNDLKSRATTTLSRPPSRLTTA
jgi:hypothetical protein